MAVMKLWTNDVEMLFHFHAFLWADSGRGSVLSPALSSLKKLAEPAVVRTTELRSMSGVCWVLREQSENLRRQQEQQEYGPDRRRYKRSAVLRNMNVLPPLWSWALKENVIFFLVHKRNRVKTKCLWGFYLNPQVTVRQCSAVVWPSSPSAPALLCLCNFLTSTEAKQQRPPALLQGAWPRARYMCLFDVQVSSVI